MGLRELAEAATPGPWHDDYWDGRYHVESPEILVVIDVEPIKDKKQAGANAAFIAAANPTVIVALLDKRDELAAESELNRRDLAFSLLGIYPGEECKGCGGLGRRSYGSTSTWHGGMGGQTITSDVCDKCWGTGSRTSKGTDLRRLGNVMAERDALVAEVEQLKDDLRRRKESK